jgi:hypothetical protein
MELFSGDLDLEQLELNLESFQKIAHGTKQADPLRNLIFISFLSLVNGFV